MTGILITDIQDQIQADKIVSFIQDNYPDFKINFDFNETGLTFPCGHTILRVESDTIKSDEVITTVKKLGFNCGILEDKIYA